MLWRCPKYVRVDGLAPVLRLCRILKAVSARRSLEVPSQVLLRLRFEGRPAVSKSPLWLPLIQPFNTAYSKSMYVNIAKSEAPSDIYVG